MEYMTMLEEPSMIGGLQELVEDPEPDVAKRTIRVFTNVYGHSLTLIASGKLDPKKYEACYTEISNVSNKLIDMLKTAENEGIILHLVRYLEAGLVSHIVSDLSAYPDIAEMTAPMLKKGVAALLDLVNTPYVGGTAFCVAIRALITVACHQGDMRERVTDVVEALLKSPPPNLFDHNIRSFHKTLQKNLFRLLRRSELSSEKERLIDLMVRVGVPRKRLVEWGPRQSKKRRSPTADNNKRNKLMSPPLAKRFKPTEEQMMEIIRFSPPSSSGRNPSPPSSGRSTPTLNKEKPNAELSLNKKATTILDEILSTTNKDKSVEASFRYQSPKYETLNRILAMAFNNCKPKTESSVELKHSENPPNCFSTILSEQHLPICNTNYCKEDILSSENLESHAEKRKSDAIKMTELKKNDSPLNKQTEIKSSDTKEVKNMLADVSSESTVAPMDDEKVHDESSKSKCCFTDRCSLKEKLTFEKLSTSTVVDMLLESTLHLPVGTPNYIPTISLEDTRVMQEKLSILLAAYIPDVDFFSIRKPPGDIKSELSATLPVSSSDQHKSLNAIEKSVVSSAAKVASSLLTPKINCQSSVDSLFASKDVDLRKEVPNGKDIDMRLFTNNRDPRTNNRDPRPNRDPRINNIFSSTDTNLTTKSIVNRDPRLSSVPIHDSVLTADSKLNTHGANVDPRLNKVLNNDPRLRNRSPPLLSTPAVVPSIFSRPPPNITNFPMLNSRSLAPPISVSANDQRHFESNNNGRLALLPANALSNDSDSSSRDKKITTHSVGLLGTGPTSKPSPFVRPHNFSNYHNIVRNPYESNPYNRNPYAVRRF